VNRQKENETRLKEGMVLVLFLVFLFSFSSFSYGKPRVPEPTHCHKTPLTSSLALAPRGGLLSGGHGKIVLPQINVWEPCLTNKLALSPKPVFTSRILRLHCRVPAKGTGYAREHCPLYPENDPDDPLRESSLSL